MSLKTRKALTLESKLDIKKKFENGIKNKALSEEYKVPHNTISTIVRNKVQIQQKVRILI